MSEDGHARLPPWRLFLEFLGSRVGGAALALGTIVVVTRTVPPAVAGEYISAIAYAQLLASLLDLGTGPTLVREAAQGDVERRVTVYVWTRGFLTAAVLAVGCLGVFVLFPAGARDSAFISLGAVAASLYGVVGPISQVYADARAYRILTLAQGAAILAAVVAVSLLGDPSAETLVAAYSLASAPVVVGAFVRVRPIMVAMGPRELAREIAGSIRAVAVLALTTGAGSVYLRIDQTLVLRYAGGVPAAYYGIAARILMQARLVPSVLQLSVSGFLAERLRRPEGLDAEEVLVLRRLSRFGGLGLALLVVANSDLAVRIVGGGDYAGADTVTAILGVGLVAVVYHYVVGTSAVMAGRNRLYLSVMIPALVLNITANIVLLPRHGIDSAALVAVATELFVVVGLCSRIPPRGGGASLVELAVVLGVACAAAVAKVEAASLSTSTNLAVSATLTALAGAALTLGYRELRSLPATGRAVAS